MKKLHLLRAIETLPCVQRKAKWALKWCDSTAASFAKHMIAFVAVEGIFFSGSFCPIFWLKKQGLMPGLCFSNGVISRDDGMHCDFACLLYSKLINKLPTTRITEIVEIEMEMEFVVDVLPVELIGMNSCMMCNYIKFCADRLLLSLGCDRYYRIGNPFEWMRRFEWWKGVMLTARLSRGYYLPYWLGLKKGRQISSDLTAKLFIC